MMKTDIFNKIIGMFGKKEETSLVIDFNAGLKLFYAQLGPDGRINSFKYSSPPVSKDADLPNAIKVFLRENGVAYKSATLSAPQKSILFKRLTIPAMPEKEALEAIRWQLKDDPAFDSSAAEVDFRVLDEVTGAQGAKSLDVGAVAVLSSEVKRQAEIIKASGLTLNAIAPPAFGLACYAEKYLAKQDGQTFGFLNIDEDACFIALVKKGKLEFFRSIPGSIANLREFLKGTLVSDKGAVQLNPPEIEEVIFNVGVPQGNEGYKDKLTSLQVLSLVRPVLERFAQEVRRSLSYYSSQFQGEAASGIYLSGLGAKIPNLDKALAKELSMEVHACPKFDFSGELALAGLAMGCNNNVNLVPPEIRSEKFEQVQKISLRLVVMVASLLLVISYIFARAGVNAYQKRMENSSLQLRVLSEVVQFKAQVDGFANFINARKEPEFNLPLALKKISNITAPEIFFDDMALDFEKKTGSVSGFIKGPQEDADDILSLFVKNAEGSRHIEDVTVNSVTWDEDDGVSRFSIALKLR